MRNAIAVVPALMFNDRAICIVSIFSPIPQTFKAKIVHRFFVTRGQKKNPGHTVDVDGLTAA